MKKSNVIILALLVACSAFLLWLWYFLGFNRVDDPLDLVISIIWWAVVIVAIVVVVKTEQVRRRRVRTVYVGETSAFNSEQGLMALEPEQPMKDVLAGILENLKYDFTREDFPEKDEFQPKFFVRTKEFEVEKQDAEPVELAEPAEPAESGVVADEAAACAPAPASERPAEQKKWKGEVVIVETKEEKPFDTPEELATILASLEAAA